MALLTLSVSQLEQGGPLGATEVLFGIKNVQFLAFLFLGSSKVELLYQNRNNLVFKPVMTPDWISKFHGNHQSKNPILKTLESGVFTGSYGYHGIEIIHFLGKS